jgi:sugar phosphate isomerase/epimerase
MSIQGPALAVASLVSNEEPFDTLDHLAAWARQRGITALALPADDARMLDLAAAASHATYANNVQAVLALRGLSLCALTIEGTSSMLAAHPAYDEALDRFAPPELRGNRAAREQWAAGELRLAVRAAFHLGVSRVVCRSGSLLAPYFAPGRTRPAGIDDTAFAELARRWLPLLELFDAADVEACFALAEGQDVCDGATFEKFLAATGEHPRVKLVYDPGRLFLQQIDYLEFIARYRERIGAFHLSDAELDPDSRYAAANGFAPPHERPLRLRSLGEGQLDLPAVFDAMFRAGFTGWATLDWACAARDAESGVGMSAAYVRVSLAHPPVEDDGAAPADEAGNRRALGLS